MTQKEFGIMIEREHKGTYEKIKKLFASGKLIKEDDFYESIVDDHLSELDDYYYRLKEMENDKKVKKVLQMAEKCLNMYHKGILK